MLPQSRYRLEADEYSMFYTNLKGSLGREIRQVWHFLWRKTIFITLRAVSAAAFRKESFQHQVPSRVRFP